MLLKEVFGDFPTKEPYYSFVVRTDNKVVNFGIFLYFEMQAVGFSQTSVNFTRLHVFSPCGYI
jgi:hypothetical protein